MRHHDLSFWSAAANVDEFARVFGGKATTSADNVGIVAILEKVALLATILAFPVLEIRTLRCGMVSLRLVIVAPHSLRVGTRRGDLCRKALFGWVPSLPTRFACHLGEALRGDVPLVATFVALSMPALFGDMSMFAADLTNLGIAHTIRVANGSAYATTHTGTIVDIVADASLVIVAILQVSIALSLLGNVERTRPNLFRDGIAHRAESLMTKGVTMGIEVLALGDVLIRGIGKRTRKRAKDQFPSGNEDANKLTFGNHNLSHTLVLSFKGQKYCQSQL